MTQCQFCKVDVPAAEGLNHLKNRHHEIYNAAMRKACEAVGLEWHDDE